MNEKELKLTDLDYAIGDHHLQMLKAALPYMEISQQKALSLFVKWNELVRTMDFFEENDDGMLSVCSLEAGHASAVDMLAAVKPYANPREQELIDVFSNILISRRNRPQGRPGAAFSPEQLIALLPPEQQNRLETIRMMLQTLGQMQPAAGV